MNNFSAILQGSPSNSNVSSERKLFLETLQKATHGQLHIQLPEGTSIDIQGSELGPSALIQIKNEATFAMIFEKNDIGLGEAYILGYWDSPQIDQLIHWAIANKHAFTKALIGLWYKIIFYKLKHGLRSNSRKGSQKNIRAHYDLGNNFYKIWLDQTMTYSSAFWGEQRDLPLYKAQNQKYQLLLEQIKAKPGDHILEIGCGWGGFAEYAAKLGFKVTGITISKEQFSFANERMMKNGLQHHVKILFQDYRDLVGTYDHVVSIEMLEAVGESYWPLYFNKIKQVVKPGGNVAIQTITIHDQEFNSYRRGTDFIQQYIFPGGMLPCENVIHQQIQRIEGKNTNLIRFGLDYARTLKIWHENFVRQNEQILKLDFKTEFQRMWIFYLKYCEGAFRSGQTNVVQISFKL